MTKALEAGDVLGKCYTLRHKMLHFLQNLVYYVTFEVVEPAWHEFMVKVEKSDRIDHVVEAHDLFLDRCLRECLFGDQELLRVLMKLMTTCLLFAERMIAFSDSQDLQGNPISKSPSSTSIEDVLSGRRRDRSSVNAQRSNMIRDEVLQEVRSLSSVFLLSKFLLNFIISLFRGCWENLIHLSTLISGTF